MLCSGQRTMPGARQRTSPMVKYSTLSESLFVVWRVNCGELDSSNSLDNYSFNAFFLYLNVYSLFEERSSMTSFLYDQFFMFFISSYLSGPL